MLAKIWNQSWDAAVRAPLFKRWLVRCWYEFISALDREGIIECMNFGYAGDDAQLVLDARAEPQYYALQMYHHVVSQINVRDKKILEVGSGRGGGAAYVMRHLKPQSYIGIDIAPRNIAFCQTHYHIPGLEFFHGDAERMDIPCSTFDAVVNIESSTHYGDIQKFFNEVARVLRPGGYLLYADTWTPREVVTLHAQFARAGLTLVEEHDMMPHVVRALELDEARRLGIMQNYTPKLLHGALREFAAMRGSCKYETYRRGQVQYVCCVLQKPDTREQEPRAPFLLWQDAAARSNVERVHAPA